MATTEKAYPASLEIEYPGKVDRLTSFFRLFWSLPILVVFFLLVGADSWTFTQETGKDTSVNIGGIVTGLSAATGLMILFRQRYPRWWFDFNLELNRFSTRVCAYLFLLTDKYPSTVEHQSVKLDLEYPDAQNELNRWLPLIKWLLALPHFIILGFLMVGALIATIIAWFAILFTGRYPRGLFDYVVGVGRWSLRVDAYALLLTTDQYPPFSLR